VSRAHCLDCGDHVVVDPAGRCPEGHHVGIAGARIEGALGNHTPHPDEPEPWVARVDLEEEDLGPASAAAPAREIRPLSAPGSDLPTAGAAATPPAARPDDLLRELQSLGELGDLAGPSGAPRTAPRPEVEAPPEVWTAPAAASPPAASAAPSTRPAFDELTALEAAVQALTADRDVAATNGHASTNGHVSANDHVSTDDLVGSTGHLTSNAHVTSNGHASPNGHAETPREAPANATPPPAASSRSIAAQLDDLFAEASAAGGPSVDPAPARPTRSEAATDAAPERWSVLADVAELAEHRPAPPAPAAPTEEPEAAVPTAPPAEAAPAEPPPPAPAADAGIDLGNFTARGKRVGSKGKRRLFGR
jgi:hypothetical protein